MGSSVPEGPNEDSQAVYCLGLRQIVTRPEGTVWSSVTPGCGCVLGLSKPELTFAVKIRLTPRNHQSYRPSGTKTASLYADIARRARAIASLQKDLECTVSITLRIESTQY